METFSEFSKKFIFQVKQCCYSDVSIAPGNTGLIYAVGSDKTLKQMQGDQMLKEVDLHTLTLSSVVQSHDGSMLFRYIYSFFNGFFTIVLYCLYSDDIHFQINQILG